MTGEGWGWRGAGGRATVAALLLGALTLVGGTAARAQQGAPRLVAATGALKLDGDFAEPDWARADSIWEFTQRDPLEGEAATERTVVRLLRDARGVWFAIDAEDREPALIRRAQLRRDASFFSDDHFTIMLSPLDDKRSGFLFSVNPNGALRDAEILNFEQESGEWDGVWDVRARVTSRGWQAEVFIPWATLRYNREQGTWGLNVRRYIRRRNEESMWRSWRRPEGIRFLETAGQVTGAGELPPRAVLELRPYAAMTANTPVRRFEATGRDTVLAAASTLGDVGLDAKLAPTGGTTLDLTVNPDFAQAEVDRQIVNLTRFSLFFPEQRTFFTEGAGIYDFGQRQRTQLFYSRRIGLGPGGTPIPILGGARFSGRVSGHQVGALVVRTGGDAPSTDVVTRVKKDLLGRGYVGAMATLSDRRDQPSSAAGGVDFNLPYIINGQNLVLLGSYALSQQDAGTASHARFVVDYPNDNADLNVRVDRISDGYDPALGFTQQSGVYRYGLNARWTPRPRRWGIRRLNFNVLGGEWVTDLAGELSNATFEVRPIGMEFERGDRLEFNLQRSFDRPTDDFDIFPGASIAPGPYWWDRMEVQYNSTAQGALGLDITGSTGEFYDGRSTQLELGLGVRLQPHFQGRFDVTQTEVTRDGGSFSATTLRLRTDYAASPWVNVTMFAQYDNQSERTSVNARLRWTTRPGNDLYVVWNSNWPTGLPGGIPWERPIRGGLIVKYVAYQKR